MNKSSADYEVLNVGTGRPVSVLQVAQALARELGWTGGFQVTGKFRAGDIRHCFADISRIRRLLGYEPTMKFEDGVSELVSWVARQQAQGNSSAEAHAALATYGLVR
jgi:dTDP-L-rhamnose 4-epimerase